jgi:hypothetical protein
MKELSLYQTHLISCIQRLKTRQIKGYDYKADFVVLSGMTEQELSAELDRIRPEYKKIEELAVF